ncbi:hypothetical protein GGP41_002728 [Bipolaris sorokiniana]|uniref:Uncharacterized protein n=1 Tax=Cochliobolus sativus TaxID=45130 RepID=A0A8H5ZMM0_COCSA|nr:hypothetical protein GGP41_002728 [Bipolaris sorokiniana]
MHHPGNPYHNTNVTTRTKKALPRLRIPRQKLIWKESVDDLPDSSRLVDHLPGSIGLLSGGGWGRSEGGAVDTRWAWVGSRYAIFNKVAHDYAAEGCQ